MSVLLETSVGDLVIDLFMEQCPNSCFNFLKLCKIKYYNNCLFHQVQKDYLTQTGDPTNKGGAGVSIWGVTSKDPQKMYFDDEIQSQSGKITQNFNKKGLVAMANKGPNMNGSAFFITLSDQERAHLNNKHTIFGQVAEGFDVLEKINQAYCDKDSRPYQNIRIKHTLIISEGPFEDQDPPGLQVPSRSPSPVANRGNVTDANGDVIEYEDRLDDDVDINGMMEGKTEDQIQQEILEHQTKTRAAVLEILEDLPDADIEPPKNVLFVCKLNPVTQDGDLRLIFSRFGVIKSCEIIRDWKTGDSLQYAFIEFDTEEACIEAYSRMEGVAIDERRIHVDFSQSVAKQWNQYRRKMLQTAADKILHDEKQMREREKERQVYQLFANYKDKEKHQQERQNRREDRDTRRPRERSHSRDRKADKHRRKRRSSSSSSRDRHKKKHHKHERKHRERSHDRRDKDSNRDHREREHQRARDQHHSRRSRS